MTQSINPKEDLSTTTPKGIPAMNIPGWTCQSLLVNDTDKDDNE